MSKNGALRTVTLILEGGHLIRLGGAVDFARLARHLSSQNSTEDVIEIADDAGQRLALRRGALIGVAETEGHVSGEDKQTFPVKSYVLMKGFLTGDEHDQILKRVLSREADFIKTTVEFGIEDYRNSVFIADDEVICSILRSKIIPMLPGIASELGLKVSASSISSVDCQITAHKDGGFYRAHLDSGTEATASRVISYVYYFRARPNAFFGGELKLYDPSVEDSVDTTGFHFELIPPEDNSIIFFRSDVRHEVLPTNVSTGEFSDLRFTVNGWVRAKV